MYDIIIIGAGPAGLTAALYALRANKNVVIFESASYGGKIINAKVVENYPGIEKISGIDFANRLYEQVKKLGAKIVYEKVINIINDTPKKVITINGSYETKAIIIATGLQNRKLNLDREANLIGKGISYCATCDGTFFKNKNVAVVGGGNTAIMDALYLADICKKVFVIYRNEQIKAEAITLNKLKEKNNVEFILNTNITKIEGTDKLSSVEITNKSGEIKSLEIEGLFIAIGQESQIKDITDELNTDEFGYVITGEDCKTNIEGIYAAGDNRKKQIRQLTTAASDGTIAALTAIKELKTTDK